MAVTWLEAQISNSFSRSDVYIELADLFRRKLWAQIGFIVKGIIHDPVFTPRLADLYDGFIRLIQGHLDPIVLARFVIEVAKLNTDKDDAIAFLSDLQSTVFASELEATLLCSFFCALFKIHQNTPESIKAAKDIIESSEEKLQNARDIEQIVYSSFYYVRMFLYRILKQPSNFLQSGLLYLSFTVLDNIPLDERINIASELGLAAIVGPSIFTFGELLQHSLLQLLQGTQYEWIFCFLEAFNAGDIAKFEMLMKQHSVSQPDDLIANNDILQQKIRICALMHMVFHLEVNNRNITFESISKHCSLPLEQVELLLMKAMSLNRIRGRINQVAQTVNITFLQPRILSHDQIEKLGARMKEWADEVHQTAIFLENQTPELFQDSTFT